uniref:Uncharacterized protein n=1 Tax=viral metagenome TaxID=1070528 RepID=A0A6C0C8H6_9ZZZZ
MIKQEFLFEHCNADKKTYVTTNNQNKIEIESFMTNDHRYLKLHTPGKYKLIIGFFKYKTEEQLIESDMIANVSFVPDKEKLEVGRVILYKVSHYCILEYIFEPDINIRIDFKNGKPLHIDILVLEEIINMPLVLTKKEEKRIFFVKIVTIHKIEYGGLFIDDKIYMREQAKLYKKEKIVSNFVIYGAMRRAIAVDKDNMYITRERNDSFISVLLNKKNDTMFISFELQYNTFQIISHFASNDLKKLVADHKKISKLII